MAALSNPRWERFCQELLVDDNQTRAYERAGYSGLGADRSAYRLIRRSEVAARVAELRTAHHERITGTAAVPKDTFVSLLIDLYGHAIEAKSWAVALRALELLDRQIFAAEETKDSEVIAG